MESLMSSLVLGSNAAGGGGAGVISCSRLWRSWWEKTHETQWRHQFLYNVSKLINEWNIRLWRATCMMMLPTWVRRSISPSISLNMASMSSICWKSRIKVDVALPNCCLFWHSESGGKWHREVHKSSQHRCEKLLSCLTHPSNQQLADSSSTWISASIVDSAGSSFSPLEMRNAINSRVPCSWW